MLGFAAGIEYRDHDGSFLPDPIAERGETAGIPSGRTAGAFDVTEFYGELNVPLIAGATGFDLPRGEHGCTLFGLQHVRQRVATYKISGLVASG